ncbi:hypothetical protein HPB51_000167 [Rhipicephalus microplus]|uniref:Uncharacterized protein n=1 Tax=Rhipicephalus microplus TaxID=6941 RepID=A0A9J6EPR1_RHIMP|nr:hypothetical protein HPB51_000167 [Rhipicephalus microplus]
MRGVESTQPITAQAHSCPVRPTAGASEEEDAGSSVSEVTAVGIRHRGDPGTRMQTRAREIEDKISRFCADSVNRITVSARNYIMSRVFELVNLCSDMRADAATERGAALALQGQLVDARREIAGLQRQALVAERPPVGDILGAWRRLPQLVLRMLCLLLGLASRWRRAPRLLVWLFLVFQATPQWSGRAGRPASLVLGRLVLPDSLELLLAGCLASDMNTWRS